MTKLPFGTNPVIRETPVMYRDKGRLKEVIVEMHPTCMVFRLKRCKGELTRLDYLVAIEAGFNLAEREKRNK